MVTLSSKRSMTRETLVIRNPGYRRHGSNDKKSGPCFFTKSVKFGFGELSICRICAESRDLQSGHGFRACSCKHKRKKLNFHEKMKVATLFCHQVGQIWSHRAVIFFPCSKSRDLGPEHGFRACSFKNKGKSRVIIFSGSKDQQNKGKIA